MNRLFNAFVVAILLTLTLSTELQAQYPRDIQASLEQRAATDPELAQALERLTFSIDATNYSPDEFLESVHVEWWQYRLSPNQDTILSVEVSGSGSVGSVLGSVLSWIDKDSGESQELTYRARSKSLPNGGLAIDVTIQRNDQPSVTTEYIFENLGGVTVVLRELDDGTRHVARFVPILDRKTTSRDYGHALTMSLTSAPLLVDDQFAGEFTVSGEIIGITSGKAGLQFEFGLKPFADATPIARTDGRTIRFELQGREYKIYSTEPITMTADRATEWSVYVHAQPSDASGFGTHAKSYDAALIQAAVEALRR